MTTEQLINLMEETYKKCTDIAKKKNHDYASGDNKKDALINFKLVEYLGVCSAETGVLVRMCDKISRIANLLNSEAHVKDESINDTINDNINYSAILKAVLIERNKDEKEKT